MKKEMALIRINMMESEIRRIKRKSLHNKNDVLPVTEYIVFYYPIILQ